MAEQAPSSQGGGGPDALDLVGQWRARLQFRSGEFAADGATFTSTIRCEAFDEAGKPVEGGGDATGRGVRLRF